MNFKKRVNGSWVDTPNYIHNTSTDTIMTLPAVIHPTGTTATVGLKGQTLQSSIPSPTSPVMPQGTGERTGNLAPPLTEWFDGYINSGTGTIHTPTEAREKLSDFIRVEPNSVYVFSHENGDFPSGDSGAWRVAGLYDVNKQFIRRIGFANPSYLGITATAEIAYIRLSFRTYGGSKNAMLNLGSTALPYEPFGVKIPISSASTTTPVYLGEVETTRKIKKLVFDGTENYAAGSVIGQIRTPITGAVNSLGYCTHYILKASYGGAFPYIRIVNNTLWFELSPDGYETKEEALADFKSYLQQQYAAGTPVCVWYVLATEETGILNEPLMKIGNYADEISGVSIPVTAGANTLSVGTTVQPSEVTVAYKGWHPVAGVHERDNGAWT